MIIKFSWLSLVYIYFTCHIFSTASVFFVVSGFAATPYVRLLYIMTYTLVCLVFLWGVRRKFYISSGSVSKVFFVYVALFPVWLALGLTDFGFYVVTDAYYMLFGVLVFFVFYNSIFYSEDIGLENKTFLKRIVLFGTLVFFLKCIGFSIPIEVVVALSVFIVIYIVHGNSKLWRLMLLFLLILLALMSNRAFYLQLIFLFYIFFAARFGFFRISFSGAFFGFLLYLFVGMYSYEVKSIFEGTAMDRRVAETISIIEGKSISDVSLPLMQRAYEAHQVESFYSDNPLYIIMGKGYGATLDMSGSEDESVVGSQLLSAESTHNIHYLHYAVMYRYGLVGLAIFLSFFIMALYFLCRELKGLDDCEPNVLRLWSSSIVVAMFVFSIFASSFVFSNPLWLMGLAGMAYCEIKRRSSS